MMDLLLPIVPILCSMLFAILALIVREHPRRSRAVLLAGASANLAAALAVLHRVTDTGVPLTVAMGGWSEPVGIGFRVDLLSAVMITVTGVVGLAGAAFAVTELGRSTWRRGYGLFFFLLLTGIHGAFLTNDLFNLFVWFEVMLMASFAMLILGRRKFVFEGATRYVVINMISSFFFLTGLGILYGKTGQLNLSVLADLLAASGDDPLILSSSAFLIIAFGIKAGAFPLFFWLPPAYPNTGFATAAVFGGLLTKVGVYALFRVFGGAFGFLAPVTAPIFLAVALATMVTGVLGAASQFRVRRILSFHIVSQIGYILLGLGLFSQGAFAAAIFYTVHHIIVKTNLFLAAGIIARTGRSERLERLGGLLKDQPVLAVLFLIPALSLGGIPPLSGFFAKFLILREAIRMEAWLTAGMALAVGVITLFSMIKIWGEAFWKESPRVAGPQPVRRAQLIPVFALAVLTVAFGLFVGPLYEWAGKAAEQLLSFPPGPSTVHMETQP